MNVIVTDGETRASSQTQSICETQTKKDTMKKIALAILLASALVATVQAGEGKGKKHEASPEQKAVHKQMLEKYDTNKDGKLDKDEKAKMSKEDKEKLKNARGDHKKDGEKKGAKK